MQTNENTDAAETVQPQYPLPRKTPMGRHFGSISYPAEEPEPVEDLRKRPSVKIMHVTAEHWMDRPSRSTGARRSPS